MKCRLLYVVGQLRSGGLERQLSYLLQGMDREQYKPAVVVWNFNEADAYVPHIRSLGVPLHALGGITGITKLMAFRRLVKKLGPEVVHSYSFYTNFAAYWSACGRRTIAVGSVRSDFVEDKRESGPCLGRLSARWPHDQIYNSWNAAITAQLSRDPFVPRRRHVVRNGVDLEQFHNWPFPANGEAVILGVGSLVPGKRWDRMVTAARMLKEQKLSFRLQILGEGPLQAPLQQLVCDQNVEDRVVLTGYIDDASRQLRDATVVVHTSDTEGCPNVVMEAMACGRPVVAMDAGDISDLVEDGRTGFVVRRGDDAGLVSRLSTLIADRDLCRRMGNAARAKAEREFGVDRLVSETFAAYRAAGWKDA